MNSRSKGKRGELEWASFLRANGITACRGQRYGGFPIAPDVVSPLPFHFEVKRVEALNIVKAMAQATRDACDNIPVVAHRSNRSDWLITMRADDWITLVLGLHSADPGSADNQHSA